MSIFNKPSRVEAPTPLPRGAAAPPSNPTASAKKEATPLSTIPFKTPEPDITRGQASIGKAVKINGQIYSKEDLYIDGDVEGTIQLQENRLTIGPNGKVRCNVSAREVVILGNCQGNVDASDKLEVRKDAWVVGDIKTARIVIEDGAYLKGSIDVVKPEPAQSVLSFRPRPQVAGRRCGPLPPPIHRARPWRVNLAKHAGKDVPPDETCTGGAGQSPGRSVYPRRCYSKRSMILAGLPSSSARVYRRVRSALVSTTAEALCMAIPESRRNFF